MSTPRSTAASVASVIAACALLGAAVPVAAQSSSAAPWTVTITPAFNPLPIGYCGAVNLTVFDPSTKDRPRNKAGYRVSMADFDMTVESTDRRAVVGHYSGSGLWSVCACQAATIGATAVITATYPAKALPDKSRVPGIAFRSQQTFTIAAARGSVQAAGCDELTVAAAIARAADAPLPDAPRTAAAQTVVDSRLAPAAAAPEAPVVSSRPSWFAPNMVIIQWTPSVAVQRYVLLRKDGAQLSVERPFELDRGETGSRPAAQAIDTLPDATITYRYTLVAHYANGSTAEAPVLDVRSGPLLNPKHFAASDGGLGSVDLYWEMAPGAIGYRLEGPGAPAGGLIVSAQAAKAAPPRLPGVPPGVATWKVTSIYPLQASDSTSPSVTSLRVMPTHGLPWLSKSNGPGNHEATVGHYSPMSPLAGFRDVVGYAALDATQLRMLLDVAGFKSWTETGATTGLPHGQADNEAVYGNYGDLGVGRRAACFQETKVVPPLAGLRTVCYATAHGATAGSPGFNDPQVITQPAMGQGDDFILAMVIAMDPRGTRFYVFTREIVDQVKLDSEGPKYVPHTCLACHGGKYNATTNVVDGASFLPIDPELLSFASDGALYNQQEKIRRMNELMMKAQPTSPVADYIRGLYKGKIGQPLQWPDADYVPTGWSQQPGLYRQVVRPYCTMCHLAAPSGLNFSSYASFMAVKELIFIDVCKAHTMPHSELQFKNFWTKETGALNVPGLLAITVGHPSCS